MNELWIMYGISNYVADFVFCDIYVEAHLCKLDHPKTNDSWVLTLHKEIVVSCGMSSFVTNVELYGGI